MWPDGNHARGIDVSHHRGVVDWSQVAASGISFGIVKATDGSTFTDSRFDSNWGGMRQAGVIRGAYHYFRPDVDSEAQARHYLNVAGYNLRDTDLPPVLDFEAYPPIAYAEFKQLTLTKRINKVRAWMNTVADATGRLPVIYTNQSTWQNVMEDTEVFTHHPLWVANYGVRKPYVPADNWGGQGWVMWQFSASGEVPGVNGGEPPVDLNIFNGKLSDFKDWLGIDGSSSPSPPDITNHQMMWALILAALRTGSDLSEWQIQARLTYLVDPASNAARPYDGLAIEELPFSDQIKQAILIAIDDVITDGMDPIYSLTNQGVINAFYQAATRLSVSGWDLIVHAGMTDLINSRDVYYIGPLVDNMESLSLDEKRALLAVINPGSQPSEPQEPEEPEEPTEPEGPEEPETPEEPLEATYDGLANQQMINAFYKMGALFNVDGWIMVSRAGLTNMADNRSGAYTGPLIEEITGLSQAQRLVLLEQMLAITGLSQHETYPGLTNQDVINLIYRAASNLGQHGWDWIEQVDMEYLAMPDLMRSLPYRGPELALISGLNTEQIQVLAQVQPQFAYYGVRR